MKTIRKSYEKGYSSSQVLLPQRDTEENNYKFVPNQLYKTPPIESESESKSKNEDSFDGYDESEIIEQDNFHHNSNIFNREKKFIFSSNFNASKSEGLLQTLEDSDSNQEMRIIDNQLCFEFLSTTPVNEPIPEILTNEVESNNSNKYSPKEILPNLCKTQQNKLNEISQDEIRNLEDTHFFNQDIKEEDEKEESEGLKKDSKSLISDIEDFTEEGLQQKHQDFKNIRKNISV